MHLQMMTTGLPLYTTSFPLHSKNVSIEAVFENAIFETFGPEEKQYLSNSGYSKDSISIESSVILQRKIPVGVLSFIPIRWNATKGQFEKLVSFSININTKEDSRLSQSSEKLC